MYRLDVGRRDGRRLSSQRCDALHRDAVTRVASRRAKQLNVYYTFNRDRFAGDAGLPLVDGDLGVPVEDNVLDVPRDRNYRTPQDDAASLDHNLQVSFARQLTAAWGFRNTLSYRHFDDEYFLSEGRDVRSAAARFCATICTSITIAGR